MGLRDRARFCARTVDALYARRGLCGRLVAVTRGARHLSLGVRLADPLKLNDALLLAEPLALATRTPAVLAQRLPSEPGLVSYQFELASSYWQIYTRADVTGLGIGLSENRQQVDFGFDPPHSLVAGTTDSGKTETVKSILCGLFTAFTPQDLRALIADPHGDYGEFQNVAHLSAPVATMPEDIDRLLLLAGEELACRRDANRRDAQRWVIVIDEAEDTLNDGRRLAIVQRIAAEARKYRMHLIVSTQRPSQKSLPGLVDKVNNRWIGLVDTAQTSALLSGHVGLDCHKLTGKGDFVHVAGAVQERLQVALATPADLARLPRAEVALPAVAVADTPRLLNFPEPRGAGRPSTAVEPRKVAYYLMYPGGPETVTRAAALEALNLARYAHVVHRNFALELRDDLARLHAAWREGGPAASGATPAGR